MLKWKKEKTGGITTYKAGGFYSEYEITVLPFDEAEGKYQLSIDDQYIGSFHSYWAARYAVEGPRLVAVGLL